MGRIPVYFCRRVLVVVALLLGSCSLDSNPPETSSEPPAPLNSEPTISGVGGSTSDNTAGGFGDVTLFEGFAGDTDPPATGGKRGGTKSGSAPTSAGGVGGATSTRSGAAAAGGTNLRANGGRSGVNAAALPPPALYFSEYVEGSSTNKALELTASHDSALDDCKVNAYFNGKTEPTAVATLTGTLKGGQVLTLCSSTLKTQLGDLCNQVARLTFNGNDALAIVCDDRILDVIGQIGVDPGPAWGSGDTTTLDHTLQRKCRVDFGDDDGLDAFDPREEWQSAPLDSFWGLGARGC